MEKGGDSGADAGLLSPARQLFSPLLLLAGQQAAHSSLTHQVRIRGADWLNGGVHQLVGTSTTSSHDV